MCIVLFEKCPGCYDLPVDTQVMNVEPCDKEMKARHGQVGQDVAYDAYTPKYSFCTNSEFHGINEWKHRMLRKHVCITRPINAAHKTDQLNLTVCPKELDRRGTGPRGPYGDLPYVTRDGHITRFYPGDAPQLPPSPEFAQKTKRSRPTKSQTQIQTSTKQTKRKSATANFHGSDEDLEIVEDVIIIPDKGVPIDQDGWPLADNASTNRGETGRAESKAMPAEEEDLALNKDDNTIDEDIHDAVADYNDPYSPSSVGSAPSTPERQRRLELETAALVKRVAEEGVISKYSAIHSSTTIPVPEYRCAGGKVKNIDEVATRLGAVVNSRLFGPAPTKNHIKAGTPTKPIVINDDDDDDEDGFQPMAPRIMSTGRISKPTPKAAALARELPRYTQKRVAPKISGSSAKSQKLVGQNINPEATMAAGLALQAQPGGFGTASSGPSTLQRPAASKSSAKPRRSAKPVARKTASGGRKKTVKKPNSETPARQLSFQLQPAAPFQTTYTSMFPPYTQHPMQQQPSIQSPSPRVQSQEPLFSGPQYTQATFAPITMSPTYPMNSFPTGQMGMNFGIDMFPSPAYNTLGSPSSMLSVFDQPSMAPMPVTQTSSGQIASQAEPTFSCPPPFMSLSDFTTTMDIAPIPNMDPVNMPPTTLQPMAVTSAATPYNSPVINTTEPILSYATPTQVPANSQVQAPQFHPIGHTQLRQPQVPQGAFANPNFAFTKGFTMDPGSMSPQFTPTPPYPSVSVSTTTPSAVPDLPGRFNTDSPKRSGGVQAVHRKQLSLDQMLKGASAATLLRTPTLAPATAPAANLSQPAASITDFMSVMSLPAVQQQLSGGPPALTPYPSYTPSTGPPTIPRMATGMRLPARRLSGHSALAQEAMA
jgi:hypothetical protein